MIKALAIAVVFLTASAAPAAAELHRFGSFVVDDKYPDLVVLAGDIQHNAPLDLRRAFRAFPDIQTMGLDSDGGDVTAGLLVAQDVYDRGISTYVPAGRQCMSACAYIFFAGASRQVEGRLGVHQMLSESGDQYSLQLAISDMLDTLELFDVPQGVISQMLRTPPEGMFIFDAADAVEAGLNRGEPTMANADVPAPPPTPSPPNASTPTPVFTPDTSPTRAYFFRASGSEGPEMEVGSVWWTKDVDMSGFPTIVAEVSVPLEARQMEAKVVWRKNTDPAIPTPTLLDISFHFPGNGSQERVLSVAGMLTKNTWNAIGVALIGASAMVSSNTFVYALSADEQDVTMNTIQMREPYYDLAIVMGNGDNALLTLEQDDVAQHMIRDVLETWVD